METKCDRQARQSCQICRARDHARTVDKAANIVASSGQASDIDLGGEGGGFTGLNAAGFDDDGKTGVSSDLPGQIDIARAVRYFGVRPQNDAIGQRVATGHAECKY